MSITLVRKESKCKRNLNPYPESEKITDTKNNNSGGFILKSYLIEGGSGGSLG